MRFTERELTAAMEGAAKSVLGPNGLPPLPARYGQTVTAPKYDLAEEDLQTYGAK